MCRSDRKATGEQQSGRYIGFLRNLRHLGMKGFDDVLRRPAGA